MINDIQYNPTKILFGKEMENQVGEEVARYSKKVLLHYGGNSFKKYGLYDRVTDTLKNSGIEFIELGGVQPNPRASSVYKGIEVCREHNIDFILAIGGGSVIDSAKAISIGIPWQGDFFDFYEGKNVPQSSIPIGVVLTLPGTGSESNGISVINHEKTGQKLPCSNNLLFPVFSILNPEVTYTLNEYYTLCGIVDAMSHIFERFFSNTAFVDCTDRICEGLLITLMKYALLVKEEPNNYDYRSEIMWASKLAHDNTVGFGRKHDWASHNIAHEIGAIYDVAHGAIIGIIFIGWMQYIAKINNNKLVQLSDNVFNQNTHNLTDNEQKVQFLLDKYRSFLQTVGLPTSLRELGINEKNRFGEIAEKSVRFMKSGTIGNFVRLSQDDIINILESVY